jgi:hypothetical protein
MALTPEQEALNFNPELQDVSRQRKLADLLMAQGMQQPQGQMISGRYVAPSWTQQLNPMANILAGQAVSSRADVQQTKLAEALRQRKGEALATFQELMSSPETRGEAMKYAAKQPDLQGIFQELMKPRDVAEGGKVVIPGIGTEGIEIAKGNPRYRAPLHYDLGSYISVRDPNDPTKEIQRLPKGISPESAARLADEGIGGYGGASKPVMPTMPTINQGSPILAKPTTSPTTMPAAGVNPFADYNNSIIPPVGLPPKDARKYMAEANTPLTGDASARVQGGLDTIDAIDSYRKILTDYSKLSSLNPTQRANLEAAYYTMTLKSKEANKLGVLNGRDQEILEKLAPNPNDIKSLLVTNNVLSEQALKQRNLITGFTVNAYGEQRKKIPEYVINKIQPLKTEITPAQAGNIERPSMIDETTWGFMTPQEKSLFKR